MLLSGPLPGYVKITAQGRHSESAPVHITSASDWGQAVQAGAWRVVYSL